MPKLNGCDPCHCVLYLGLRAKRSISRVLPDNHQKPVNLNVSMFGCRHLISDRSNLRVSHIFLGISHQSPALSSHWLISTQDLL